MAAFSVRSPTWHVLGISLFLLLVLLQMLTSLVYCAGVFTLSNEAPVSFVDFRQHDEGSYNEWHRSSATVFYTYLLILCFYVPVVLVHFALLAMLLAAYAKDRTTLRFSLVCQAASSALFLTGLISFLLIHLSFLKWKDMTLCFYICVGVPIELAITTLLTATVYKKNQPPGWE